MNFDHFQKSVQRLIASQGSENEEVGNDLFPTSGNDVPPEQLHPLVLAYIGDAYFNMYVRMRLLSYGQNKVRVLHSIGSKMVSAVMQSKAVLDLEECLNEKESQVLRRGRNAKSKVPKSASLQEYRYSTGFEAVLGYLFLQKNTERLSYIADKSFNFILQQLNIEESK